MAEDAEDPDWDALGVALQAALGASVAQEESEVKRGRTCQPVQWAEEILQVNIESNLLLHHQSKVQTYLSVTPPPRNSMLTCNISCFKGHPTHPTQH